VGGLERGDSDFEPILPAPIDTRTAEDLFPDYGMDYENAWAWNSCDIESTFNQFREKNWLEEIHDPDCNTENLDTEMDSALDDLS
jgi:hypothetical protein